MNALDRTRSNLRRCHKNPRHSFVLDSGSCTLCRLPRDPFPYYGEDQVRLDDTGKLSIGDLIREAGQLPVLQPFSQRCREPDVLAYERSVPRTPPSLLQSVSPIRPHAEKSKTIACAGWLLAVGLVLFCVSPSAGIGGVSLGVVLLIVAGLQIKAEAKAHAKAVARAALELKARQDAAILMYEPVRQAALAAIDKMVSIEARARELDLAASAALRPLAKVVAETREWLSKADSRLQAELRNADRTYRNHQLTKHLERIVIARASIDGIGPSRKALLASFGIETAADVEQNAIMRIAGFGPGLTDRLLSWRRSCEQEFYRRGAVKTPPEWLQRIQHKHSDAVTANATRLRGLLAEYHGVYLSYDKQLTAVAMELDQARRECRTALNAANSA